MRVQIRTSLSNDSDAARHARGGRESAFFYAQPASCDRHLDLRAKPGARDLKLGRDNVSVLGSSMGPLLFLLRPRAATDHGVCLERVREGRVFRDDFPGRYFGELIFLQLERSVSESRLCGATFFHF